MQIVETHRKYLKIEDSDFTSRILFKLKLAGNFGFSEVR